LLTVDRIEGQWIIIETDKGNMKIPMSEFDETLHEGDIIIEDNGRYTVDKDATEARRRYIAQKLSKMWEDKK
jgi:hypothetical protein